MVEGMEKLRTYALREKSHPLSFLPERGQNLETTVGAVQIPGPPVSQVLVEGMGLKRLDDPNIAQSRMGAVREEKVDEALDAREGQSRFGSFLGERLQAASFTAGQNKN
jgi:hypothetical protein